MSKHLAGMMAAVFAAGMLITGPALADHRPGDAGVGRFPAFSPDFGGFCGDNIFFAIVRKLTFSATGIRQDGHCLDRRFVRVENMRGKNRGVQTGASHEGGRDRPSARLTGCPVAAPGAAANEWRR